MKKLLLLPICVLCVSFSVHAAQVNKVAAVVNGQVITMFDLQKVAIPDLMRAGINPNNPAQHETMNQILHKTLDLMVMDILIAQEAKRLKISITSSDVDKELARMMKVRGLTKEQFEAQLAKDKFPVSEVRANIEKNMLRQKIMGMEVGRRVVVTPEEIKDYYESHKSTLYDRSGLHMALLVYPPNIDPRPVAAKIRDGSLTFAEVARRYSIAPNRDKAGDMGPVEWDRLNPEWEGRLTKMKPGDVTDLFDLNKHKAQVWLFRPGGDSTLKLLSLEEATPEIDNILRQPRAMKRFEEYTSQLRNKAVIDIRL